MSKIADPGGRRVFRSPSAVAIWWLWVFFAVCNLIDLAIQGRDHFSLVAAITLLAITGVMYVTAQRPRLVAEADGLTIVNPVRAHRVAWSAVAGFETTDLLRVRCAWPAEKAPTGAAATGDAITGPAATGAAATAGTAEAAAGERKRVIYAWAVRSSRRGQIAAEARAKRRAARAGGGSRARLGFGALPPDNSPPPAPLGLDAASVVGTLTERIEKARAAAPDARAVAPVSDWHWPSIAAVTVPVVVLVVAIIA